MGFLLAIPGLLRTLGCVLASIGPIVSELPIEQISIWGNVISSIGAVTCGAGVLRAGLRNFLEK